MSNKIVELDFCCPECNCSQWQKDEDARIYFCVRCNHVVAFDEDDPDYDECDDDFDYDGDTGRAFINGQWQVISPRTWEGWHRGG
ncbi:hypothetical protein H6G36_02250 [Anabaena minutissima FACHB-250]|nr:hypothetical protein [Anabaena minutissima FACHB-250]